MTDIWSTYWTLKGVRYLCDWDSQEDALVHATLLTESGRQDVFTARRELEPPPPEVEERVRARMAARAKGKALEDAAREGRS